MNYLLLCPQPRNVQQPSSYANTGSLDRCNVKVSRANRLHQCKTAILTDDGKFLLPHEVWTIGVNGQSAVLVRQAYKDHWKIIYNHYVVENSIEPVIISGSPGCGKSVEGIYFLNRIFDMYSENAPPILYASSSISTSPLAYFK
jgi:hypothetical protein